MAYETIYEINSSFDKFNHLNDFHYEAFVGSAIVMTIFLVLRITYETEYYKYIFFALITAYIIVCVLSLLMGGIKLQFIHKKYAETDETLLEVFGASIWLYPVSRIILLILLIVELLIIIYF